MPGTGAAAGCPAAVLLGLGELIGQLGVLRLQLAHILHSHFEPPPQVVQFLAIVTAACRGVFGLLLGFGEPAFELFVLVAQFGQLRGRFAAGFGPLLGRSQIAFQRLPQAAPLGLLGRSQFPQLVQLFFGGQRLAVPSSAVAGASLLKLLRQFTAYRLELAQFALGFIVGLALLGQLGLASFLLALHFGQFLSGVVALLLARARTLP